jgi:hypothetical protein
MNTIRHSKSFASSIVIQKVASMIHSRTNPVPLILQSAFFKLANVLKHSVVKNSVQQLIEIIELPIPIS